MTADTGRFRGTCYRAANWQLLGLTNARDATAIPASAGEIELGHEPYIGLLVGAQSESFILTGALVLLIDVSEQIEEVAVDRDIAVTMAEIDIHCVRQPMRYLTGVEEFSTGDLGNFEALRNFDAASWCRPRRNGWRVTQDASPKECRSRTPIHLTLCVKLQNKRAGQRP